MLDTELEKAERAVKEWEGQLLALMENEAPPANYEDLKKLYESRLEIYRKRVEYLVQSGLQPGAGWTETQAAQLAEIHADLVGRRSVFISTVNSLKWEEIREHCGLVVKVHKKPLQPSLELKSADKVPLFGWADASERKQADRYGTFIQGCISSPEDVVWIDANHHPSLLETMKGRVLPFTLKGTTDYAAVDRDADAAFMPDLGLRVLFELKKVINRGSVYQALVKLVAANIHTPDNQPVMVHTDLRDSWHIYWMDGSTIYTYTPTSRFEAVAIIEDVLRSPVPCELGTSSSASAIEETEGISRLLKRRKFAEPEGGGGGPCGQLTELAGLLPEGEFKAALVESVVQQLNNTPAVAAMQSVPAGMYC
jgi:hypothetical protein